MKKKAPRILIGGTGSDCGKTTLTCSILKAFKDKYDNVSAFKCGPDYIDPMFHSEIIGAKSRNLDLYLCGDEVVKSILGENSFDDGISIIEGVMGIYDGFGFDNDDFSANHIAKITGTPEVLVVNVRGKSASILAEISGYLNMYDNNIKGVILNKCSRGMYGSYKSAIESKLCIKCYGFLPIVEGAGIENRHLGLVTAGEIEDLKHKVDLLGKTAKECIDLEGLEKLAKTAPEIQYSVPEIENICAGSKRVKIAVAFDKAFNFYYEDNFEYLKKAGADIVFFSPMGDEKLPEEAEGLIIGGGYPEVYADVLSKNKKMLKSIYNAVNSGIPTYAECGGFMYLGKSIKTDNDTYEMVGVIDSSSYMTSSLVRFGYKNLVAEEDNILAQKGESVKCHEFHYSDSTNNGEAFTATNRRGKEFKCFVKDKNILAGYPHIHFGSNPHIAENFVRSCLNHRK